MHLLFSFLVFILPKTGHKRTIYVIFKINLNPHREVVGVVFWIVKRTVFNQLFELDDEQNRSRKGGESFIQQIYL